MAGRRARARPGDAELADRLAAAVPGRHHHRRAAAAHAVRAPDGGRGVPTRRSSTALAAAAPRPARGDAGMATASRSCAATSGRAAPRYETLHEAALYAAGDMSRATGSGSRATGGTRGRRSMALTRTKFILPEDRIPRAWYNINADLPVPLSPPLHPGTLQPIGPDDLAAALPHGPHRPGDERGARDRDPRARSARRTRMYRPSPLYPRPPPRGGARHARPTSTTSTRASARPAATSPTRPSRRPSTTSEEGVRRLTTETGAGQWGSALAFAGAHLRPRGHGLHGARLVRPEARPPHPHADVRGRGRGQPERPDRATAEPSWRRRPTPPARWASPSARPSRMPPPATTRATRWARCSTTCCCTRPSSARRPWSRWPWPARSPTSSSPAPAAAPTSRA